MARHRMKDLPVEALEFLVEAHPYVRDCRTQSVVDPEAGLDLED